MPARPSVPSLVLLIALAPYSPIAPPVRHGTPQGPLAVAVRDAFSAWIPPKGHTFCHERRPMLHAALGPSKPPSLVPHPYGLQSIEPSSVNKSDCHSEPRA